MNNPFTSLIVASWNALQSSLAPQRVSESGLQLGYRIVEERRTSQLVCISESERTQHLVSYGKTGFGKSRFFRSLLAQDVRARRGFLLPDRHGDNCPYVFQIVANEERRTGEDLSGRLIPINLLDPTHSVGFNPLQTSADYRFRNASEIAALLRKQFDLNTLGARTEELTRNVLHLAADAGLTLVDVPLLLTDPTFLASALQHVTNEDVRYYFLARYGQVSEQMQATMREPLLNKLSAFIGNPVFRRLLGQSQSTFSISEALDNGYWIIVDLQSGKLGPEAVTLAGLILTWLQAAVFRRNTRQLFSVYADEVQTLVAHAEALEILLAESRKYGIGVMTANQYSEQHSPEIRAALLSVANFVLFRLSAPDAEKFAGHLGGGKHLAELLKNLPQRHAVVKHGDRPYQHIVVPQVSDLDSDYADLYARCRARWMKPNTEIEAEILGRQ